MTNKTALLLIGGSAGIIAVLGAFVVGSGMSTDYAYPTAQSRDRNELSSVAAPSPWLFSPAGCEFAVTFPREASRSEGDISDPDAGYWEASLHIGNSARPARLTASCTAFDTLRDGNDPVDLRGIVRPLLLDRVRELGAVDPEISYSTSELGSVMDIYWSDRVEGIQMTYNIRFTIGEYSYLGTTAGDSTNNLDPLRREFFDSIARR